MFAAHGVTLNIQTSAGSQQNLDRLHQDDAPSDLAFVRGGFGDLGTSTDYTNSRRAALKLLEQARIDPVDLTLSPLTGNLAAQALAQGNVDVIVLVAAPQAEPVQNMIRLPGVQPVGLRLTAAITERNPA